MAEDPGTAKLVAKIEQVLSVARAAADRLWAARDPLEPPPTTKQEMLEIVDRMALTPKKYGVTIMPYEAKALRAWSRFQRALWANEKPSDPETA